MDDIYKLAPNDTARFAQELTLKAIENHMIMSTSSDPEATAKDISKFYVTLVEHLND